MSNGFGMDPVPGDGPSKELNIGNACLIIKNGPKSGEKFLLNKNRLTIGRNDPPNVVVDINLTDCELSDIFTVSRRHAEIFWDENELKIHDLGSKNGTQVNNNELPKTEQGNIPQASTLKIGDIIIFGDIEAEVAINEE